MTDLLQTIRMASEFSVKLWKTHLLMGKFNLIHGNAVCWSVVVAFPGHTHLFFKKKYNSLKSSTNYFDCSKSENRLNFSNFETVHDSYQKVLYTSCHTKYWIKWYSTL